jgi:WhiB family redox-sensing transcriptional regulator
VSPDLHHLNNQWISTEPHRAWEAEPEWMLRGACNGVRGDLFFPSRGESSKEAKAICSGCEVRETCLDYALEHGEKWGVWGGASERERRKIRHDLGGTRAIKRERVLRDVARPL